MKLARAERVAITAELDRVGPTAPTLCAGWTTHDLTAHLWVREHDPLAVPGIFAAPLSGLTKRRMDQVCQRWSFAELVDRIRRGPARLSVFALPGVDAAANAMEYFVHHEDVRRANGQFTPRELCGAHELELWRRVRSLARLWFRKSPVGVVLDNGHGEQVKAVPGARIVTLVGAPSEHVLFGFGRGEQAKLNFIGDPTDVAQLQQLSLGI